MKYLLTASLFLLLAGCSVSGEASHAARGCEVEFTPVETLYEETYVAADRWSQSTSCNIHVGTGGIPVELAEQILSEVSPGKQASGETKMTTVKGVRVAYRILVHEFSPDRYRTTLHEMGHAIGGHGHTDSWGILSKMRTGATDVIDSESLSLVCQTLSCGAMTPEPATGDY